jgi:alginate O-acetyltransferase complex protein AlgI
MLFNSLAFLGVFLPITYLVFWALRSAQSRYVWLTITGYVFYSYWDPRFSLLMAFSTLVSYSAGRGLLRWQTPRARRLCLILSVTVDLCLLGFFKYADFGLGIAETGIRWLGISAQFPRLHLLLPIGISFYTFHTITYIVDCYRGVVRPTRNFFEYSCYVSLFSQLVAGPIVRFRQIEADLAGLGSADRGRWLHRGISFFIVGLVEKVLVADTLAAFVNPAFAHSGALSTLGAWMAVSGYTLQLYFDFSGYSTMAVGLGLLFGVRIPQNFNSPYQAVSPSDFWRRWHISLSTCLRDYLYIPLGGNRLGPGKTVRNLLLTMGLGGLWHGAGWTFVLWGLYHGILLTLFRRWNHRWEALPRPIPQLGTLLLVMVGWVLFRSASVPEALTLLGRMFVPAAGLGVPNPLLPGAALLLAGGWALAGRNPFEWTHQWGVAGKIGLAVAFGLCLALILGSRPSPFLYFQF